MTVDLATPLWIIAAVQLVRLAKEILMGTQADPLQPVQDQLDRIETTVTSIQKDDAKLIADLQTALGGNPGEDQVLISKATLATVVGRLTALQGNLAAVDAAEVAADAAANPPAPTPTPAANPPATGSGG
jgi:hypothetical protein